MIGEITMKITAVEIYLRHEKYLMKLVKLVMWTIWAKNMRHPLSYHESNLLMAIGSVCYNQHNSVSQTGYDCRLSNSAVE